MLTRRGCKARGIDTTARAADFASIFSSLKLPDNYFEKQGTNPTRFNVHCDQALNALSSHWRPKTARAVNLKTFSIAQWKALPQEDAAKPTPAKCNACAVKYTSLQESFPLKPIHRAPDNLQELYESPEVSNRVVNEACVARALLSSVNEQHVGTFGRTFTDALVTLCPEETLHHKQNNTQRK